MTPTVDDRKREYGRQIEHWRLASARLGDLESVAPVAAWQSLEHYLGVSLRTTLQESVRRLASAARVLERRLRSAGTAAELRAVRADVLRFRRAYTRAETSVDFFADALATRAAPRMGALLRACDHIATRSMAEALAPLGRQVPAALTFVDAGLGAAVLKAGLRLWDGGENPVAAIKVVRHNLFRPTSIIHEAGHQVAHMLGWNDELAAALRDAAGGATEVGAILASWSSEIAADAFAFVHTGYASVTALHDVIDGGDDRVFQYVPSDPHPVGYLRLLLAVEWCRIAYGAGPWDALAGVWTDSHPLTAAPADLRGFYRQCVSFMPTAARVIIGTRFRAFGGKPLTEIVNPQQVSPRALEALGAAAGQAAFTSSYWIWNEAIRLLALTGWRAAASGAALREATAQQEKWMLTLGRLRTPAAA